MYRKFKSVNWRLAQVFWKYQNKALDFLLDRDANDHAVFLGCGLAGTIYIKRDKETVWKNSDKKISELFEQIKIADIDCINSNKSLYKLTDIGKKLKVICLHTGKQKNYNVPKILENDIAFFKEKKESYHAAMEQPTSAKKTKILNKARHDLDKACKINLIRVLRKLTKDNKAILVDEKFENYLKNVEEISKCIQKLKEPQNIFHLFKNPQAQKKLRELAFQIRKFANFQLAHPFLSQISSKDMEIIIRQNNVLLDCAWGLDSEILDITEYTCNLLKISSSKINNRIFRQGLAIASVLRGLDKKLETRGRDSCGLSIMFVFTEKVSYETFIEQLVKKNLQIKFQERCKIQNLANFAIDTNESKEDHFSFTFTYKTAKAIGQLGDNVRELKEYIYKDNILRAIISENYEYFSTVVHTRWASQGIVSIENCHPVDNKGCYKLFGKNRETTFPDIPTGHIYAVLNGDIDNHLQLSEEYEKNSKISRKINEKISTDAKVIPLTIENYIAKGLPLEKAFTKALNRFSGSFAIEMHSDLEPGKIYLAQQGKGQGLYVGISSYGYHVASEIYGFVEQTCDYISMEPGQIFVLDQNSSGGISGINAMDFQGRKIKLTPKTLATPITTRDIFLDTKKHSHFLEKEIRESSQIITKTLRGKWEQGENKQIKIRLGEEILPSQIQKKLLKKEYRKVLFLGMGTAHAAADAIAATFRSILSDHCDLQFECVLATEFTATYTPKNRSNTLAIAISQSGGTTDTNAAVRKLVDDSADLLGIVNKRDSDMTFLVDGILYTGDGRDVEIAVASTKAFYAQVVAGTLYALSFAQILNVKDPEIQEIPKHLLQLPEKLDKLFENQKQIEYSATSLAPKHTYWDTLSTGIGQPVANEVKIKLSELCYMSIPDFFAANKKHINLSAEALILCFFGALEGQNSGNSLIKDLQGEISIFLAQKNIPVVFTTEDDRSFDKIIPKDKKQAQLLKVIPPVPHYLSVILNTAAGHLWSYYAAKALNHRSEFIAQILEEVTRRENIYKEKNMKSFEIILQKDFRNVLKSYYQKFRHMMEDGLFTNGLQAKNATHLEKLMLIAMGVIPTSASSFLFGKDWGAENILNELKSTLSFTRSWLSRSIDAIKHQAKYITVGVTGFEGISSMPDGVIKDFIQKLATQKHIVLSREDVNEYDMITLTNIQKGVKEISGGLVYQVFLESSEIWLKMLANVRFGVNGKHSRYEKKGLLVGGRKMMAMRSNKVHIGRGHDNSKVIVIPLRVSGQITKLLVLKFKTRKNLNKHEKVELLGGAYSSNSKAIRILTVAQENREQLVRYHHFPEDISDEEFLADLLEKVSVEDLLLLPHEDISQKIISSAKKESKRVPK